MANNLLDYDLDGLTEYFASIGEKPFRAKQVLRWMHHFGADNAITQNRDEDEKQVTHATLCSLCNNFCCTTTSKNWK